MKSLHRRSQTLIKAGMTIRGAVKLLSLARWRLKGTGSPDPTGWWDLEHCQGDVAGHEAGAGSEAVV